MQYGTVCDEVNAFQLYSVNGEQKLKSKYITLTRNRDFRMVRTHREALVHTLFCFRSSIACTIRMTVINLLAL